MKSKKTEIESARGRLLQKIKNLSTHNFDELALAVFNYQYKFNPLYQAFVQLIKVDPREVTQISEIPFLPIQFFKQQNLQTGDWEPAQIFSSSGTTGVTTAQHYLRSESLYKSTAKSCFESFYGPLEQYCYLALLPSYLERKNSSLVYMAQYFIEQSSYSESGFYLQDLEKLIDQIQYCRAQNIPVVLLGVSFALLDLAERYQINAHDLIVMETGGMKGRRKEITRQELHKEISKALGVPKIHSEYGMTELFSQAYSKGDGIFYSGPSLKIIPRELNDPKAIANFGRTGALNFIDLANLDTISFIASDDLGKVFQDGSFMVLGRMDHSDLRGCNLLIDQY